MRTLVLGGIRSGKSRWAESAIAASIGPGQSVCYLATGTAPDSDPEWTKRTAEHRGRRPQHWSTIENPDISSHLLSSPSTATLVDDLGGWLTAVMDRRDAWRGEPVATDVDDLVATVGTFGAPLVLVSPEVGLTVVPATESGRRFADELGLLNQRLAALCERVVLVVAGLALPLKGSPTAEPEL